MSPSPTAHSGCSFIKGKRTAPLHLKRRPPNGPFGLTVSRRSGGAGFSFVCCEFPAAVAGRKRQHARTVYDGGPHGTQERTQMSAAIVSEPIRRHQTHSTADQTMTVTFNRMLAWRSPPNGNRRCPITPVTSNQGKCTRNNVIEQFRLPVHMSASEQKRLRRERAKRTVLALEWREVIQIGRCKVRCLSRGAYNRNKTRH